MTNRLIWILTLWIIGDLYTSANGQDGDATCDTAAARACLDTLYMNDQLCAPMTLTAAKTCLVDLLVHPCLSADTDEFIQNLTMTEARCADPCDNDLVQYKPCGTTDGACVMVDDNTGDHTCNCPPGWTGDRCEQDIDECTDDLDDCGETSECLNKPGSYLCTCAGDSVYDSTSKTCEVFNNCEFNILNCQHLCDMDTKICGCQPGFTLNTDGKTCDLDDAVDPCIRTDCDHGCTKEGETETCFCRLGYMESQDDSTQCSAIDQCADGVNPCQNTNMCTSTEGRLQCGCPDGEKLQADGRTCQECEGNKYGTNCENTCDCSVGFVRCDKEMGCKDCKVGYTGDDCDERDDVCTDGICGDQGTCDDITMDEGGGYKCSCDDGYRNANGRIRGVCQPFDECVNDYDNDCEMECNKIDQGVGYTCDCRTGYTLNDDDLNCDDINECEPNDGKGECEFACDNTDGSFTCSCDTGYELKQDKRTCQDKNECAPNDNKGECEFACDNTVGSFTCRCDTGYELEQDERTCLDKNECEPNDGKGECEFACDNTDGSFTCKCDTGYELEQDKRTCQDINECLEDTHGCMHDCNNTVGSFACYCNENFTLAEDRKTCYESCVGEDTCPDNSVCQHLEDVDICVCSQSGFNYVESEDSCKDIDECMNNTLNDCGNARCENTQGSFDCKCPDGYELDSNNNCIDIKECDDEDVCTGGTKCIEREGGYLCPCDPSTSDNTTIQFQMSIDPDFSGDVASQASVIIEAMETMLNGDDDITGVVPDGIELFKCSTAQPDEEAATRRRRLLQSGTLFNFALVAPTGLTDEKRAQLAEVVATTLNNGDLTVGDKQLTITDTSVVSGGDVVPIRNKCTYLNLLQFCDDGQTCQVMNNSTECVEVPVKNTGLSSKAVTAIAASSALVGLVLIALIIVCIFICYKQRHDTSDHSGGKGFYQQGFDYPQRSYRSSYDKRTTLRDAPFRMSYHYHKRNSNGPSFATAMHSGTQRGWRGESAQGWQPTVGRSRPPSWTPPSDKESEAAAGGGWEAAIDGLDNAIDDGAPPDTLF